MKDIPVKGAEVVETLELSTELLPDDHGRGLFALRVEGHSMADALIEDGDVVVLRAQETCENGQTVAVWLKDQRETTLRRFYLEGDRVQLRPENARMEPIFTPASNVEVQGRLVVVVRQIENNDRGLVRDDRGTEREDRRHPRGNVVSIPVIGRIAAGEPIPVMVPEPIAGAGLVGPDGRPLDPDSKGHRIITNDLIAVGDGLLRWLGLNPWLVYELSPRRFEEVVAELLHRQGYDVTLTRASKDGGVDIYAARKDALGSFLYLVECKRYAPGNRVGLGLVQRLHGVVQANKATAGILATTSFFTKDAKRFQEEVKYQMSLRDYLNIMDWLKSS